jgi:hypothetical protein
MANIYKDDNLQSTKRETDDGVIPGEWRREVGTSFNVMLRDTQKIGKGGNNPGTTALNLRNGLGQ